MNTRNLLNVIVIALGSGVALAACSTTEEQPFASSDSYCSARAEAECNGLAKKCGASIDACKQKRVSTCNTNGATAANQGRSYRAGSVQTCLDSVNSTYKNGGNDVTADAETETNKVCERVYSGSKQAADPCASTFECDGSLVCDRGVCIKEEKVALKGQCNNAGQVCETGSYCQLRGDVKFCVEKNKEGDSCKADAPCIETLRCLTGRCAPRVTAGNPCDNDGECAAEAPYCDVSAKKCRPKYESTSAACKEYGL